LSSIEQYVTKISPKIRLHWDMRWTVGKKIKHNWKININVIIQ